MVGYRPTGCDRDSYISGVRRGGGGAALHDVNARRDNLPDNVFAYLKESVAREAFESGSAEEARIRHTVMNASGKGGKRIAGGATGDWESLGNKLTAMESVGRRHTALSQLYAAEMADWSAQLAMKGLAIQ